MKDDGTEKLRFDGRVKLGESICRYSVAGSFRENDFTTLALEIFWHGEVTERRKALASFMNNRMNHIWIPNDDPRLGHLELLGLRGYTTEFSQTAPISTTLNFSSLQCGIHRDVESKDRKLHVTVRMLPSGLLSSGIHMQHYTGELAIDPLPDITPIRVQTTYGELVVRETFNFEDDFQFGNKIAKRVPQTTAYGDITVPQGATLYDVHEKLFDELETIRVALSLCYRQLVRIVHVTYRDQEDRQRAPAYYRRRLTDTVTKGKAEAFIDARALGNGGLKRLTESIRRATNSADLVRAIDFLASSYENDLENAFFMTFSALETVVNLSSGSDEPYSGSDWKAIRRATEETVRKVAAELQIDPTDLLAKLPELKRLSFRRRLELACAKLGPVTGDLFPKRDFFDGMAEAASIRNGLFHAARYTERDALADSLIRTRTFTERLIAKLLGWPDEQLWVWRDSDLRFLNRSDAAEQRATVVPPSQSK